MAIDKRAFDAGYEKGFRDALEFALDNAWQYQIGVPSLDDMIDQWNEEMRRDGH